MDERSRTRTMQLRYRGTATASFFLFGLGAVSLHAATVTREPWGKSPAGDAVDRYTLKDRDTEIQLCTYGARVTSISVPDRQGTIANVVLGFDKVDEYFDARTSVMGATIGRYANRIAKGEFQIDGTTYHIPQNNNGNALHGGPSGFDKKVWTAAPLRNGVRMTLVSPDGDMGFPGSLTVHVDFRLVRRHGEPALTIAYTVTTDRPTVVNLTNHSYFNLSGDSSKPVFDDLARIEADEITPVSSAGIPTGILESVNGTPFDLRRMRLIGEGIPDRGYDQNFVLRDHLPSRPVAEVQDRSSGRSIQVFTDQPGLQFYVPKFSPTAATNAPVRRGMAAFCLETQHFPDAPNQSAFPSTEVLPTKPFHSVTTYSFGVKRSAKPSTLK